MSTDRSLNPDVKISVKNTQILCFLIIKAAATGNYD